MFSTDQDSDLKHLINYFEENKDKPWEDWLKIENVFPRPGKQGFVGIMKTKNQNSFLRYVFKVPRYINYLSEHEFEIMKSLNEISFCPHFCRCIGMINANVDMTKQKGENPFATSACKKPIEKSVLLMEYLKDSFKFYNFLSSKTSSEDQIYSILRQVILAIYIAQIKKKFTHYDLHSNNIMISKCNENIVYLYVIDNENQFLVPTFGYHSVIIDFGFSYCIDIENKPLNASLNFTDSGFMSDRFDSFSDMKLFLVTATDEINDFKRTKRSKKLLNIAKNVFSPLNIDWDSGWDNDTKKCVNDHVLKILHSINESSKTFKDYDYYCMDILLSLITLPLKKQKYEDVSVCFNSFIRQFIKIEEQISSPFYCLYILKSMIDVAKCVKRDYESSIKETRQIALDYFRSSMLERIDSIALYFDAKKINFEILLCSLFCLLKNIEGMLYNLMLDRERKKNKEYDKLLLKTPIEILTAIELSIPLNYVLNEKTNIIEINCITESKRELPLISLFSKNEIVLLNDFNSFSQAKKIFDKINV